MSSGRGRTYGSLAALLSGAALLTTLMVHSGHRPVDARRVTLPPPSPSTVNATHTTSVAVVGSVAADPERPPVVPPPALPPLLPKPDESSDTHGPAEPSVPQPKNPLPPLLQQIIDGLGGCDRAYETSGPCVPWLLPTGLGDTCAWLREMGLGPIQVHGTDRHHLDIDLDGIACGTGDRR